MGRQVTEYHVDLISPDWETAWARRRDSQKWLSDRGWADAYGINPTTERNSQLFTRYTFHDKHVALMFKLAWGGV
jgi:hypothetical protein